MSSVNFRLRLILGMSKMPSRLRFLRLPKLQSRSFRAARATRSRSRDGSSVSLSQSKLRPIPYQRVTLTDQRTGPNRVARAQLETRGGERGHWTGAECIFGGEMEIGWDGKEEEQFAAWLPPSLPPSLQQDYNNAHGQGRTASDAFFAVVIIAYSIDFLPAGGARSSASKAASSPIFGMPRNLEARARPCQEH